MYKQPPSELVQRIRQYVMGVLVKVCLVAMTSFVLGCIVEPPPASGQVGIRYTLKLGDLPKDQTIPLPQEHRDAHGNALVTVEFTNSDGRTWQVTFPQKPADLEINYRRGNTSKSYSGEPLSFSESLPLEITISNIDQSGRTLECQLKQPQSDQTKIVTLNFSASPAKQGDDTDQTDKPESDGVQNTQIESVAQSTKRITYLTVLTLVITSALLVFAVLAWLRRLGPPQNSGGDSALFREQFIKRLEDNQTHLSERLSNTLKEELSNSFASALKNPPQEFITTIVKAASRNDYETEVEEKVVNVLMREFTEIKEEIKNSGGNKHGTIEPVQIVTTPDTNSEEIKQLVKFLNNDLSGAKQIIRQLIEEVNTALRELRGKTAHGDRAGSLDHGSEEIKSTVNEEASLAGETTEGVSVSTNGLELEDSKPLLTPQIEEERKKVSARLEALKDYFNSLKSISYEYVSKCEKYLISGEDEYKEYLESIESAGDEAELKKQSQEKLDWFNKNIVKYVIDQSCKELKQGRGADLDLKFTPLIEIFELKSAWPHVGDQFCDTQHREEDGGHFTEYESPDGQRIKEVLSPCVFKTDDDILVRAWVKIA